MSDVVKTIIDQEAYDQVNKLTEELNKSKEALLDLLKAGQGKPNWTSLQLPKDLHKLIEGNKTAIAGLTKELDKQKKINEALVKSMAKLKEAKEKLHKASLQEQTDRQIVNLLDRKHRKMNSQVATSYEQLALKLNLARREYKHVAVSMGENSREARKLQKEVVALDKKLKKIDANVGQHQRSVGNYGKAWGNVGGMMRGVIAAFGIYSGIDIVRKLYAQIKVIDQLNKSLTQVTSGVESFGEAQEYIIRLADRTGIEINTLQKTYTKFLASAKETNLTLIETKDIFSQTAMTGALLGLSTDDINGSMRALEQILSKGKVQAEEIRGQLGERLPGAFQILAKSMKITTGELNRMLERGEVISEDVLPGFARELARTYSLDKIENIRTIAAAQGRLTNEWNLWIRDLDKGNNFISDVIIGTLGAFADGLRHIKEQISAVSTEFKIINNVYETFVTDLQQFRRESKETVKASEGLLYVWDVLKEVFTMSVFEVWATILEFIRVAFDSIAKTIVQTGKELKEFFRVMVDSDVGKAFEAVIGWQTRIKDAFVDTWVTAANVVKINRKKIQDELDEFVKHNLSLRPFAKDQIEIFPNMLNYGGVFDKKKDNDENKPKDPKGKPEKDYTAEDAFNLTKSRLEREIELQQQVSKDTENELLIRLNANQIATGKQLELLELERDWAIANAEGRTDKLTQINEEYFNKQTDTALKHFEEYQKILESDFATQYNKFKDLETSDDTALREEIITLRDGMVEKGATVKEIEDAIVQLKKDALKEDFENQLKYAEMTLMLLAETDDERELVAQKILELREKISQLGMPDKEEGEGGLFTQEEIDKIEKWAALAMEALTAVFDLADAFSERRIANIEREMEKNEEMYDGILANEDLTERQRKSIENQKELDRLKLEKKLNKEKRKQAKIQKAQAASNVIIQTSLGVISALAQVPKFDFGISANAVAGIIAGIGAAQLATVLAQPLPEYEFGKSASDGYTGPMIWGEKRNEIKVGADGKIEVSPNKPTLGQTKKGDTIYPSMKEFTNSVSYDQIVQAAMLTSIENQHQKFSGYQLENVLDSHLLKARDEMRKGVEDAMKSWKFPKNKDQDFEGLIKRMHKRDV